MARSRIDRLAPRGTDGKRVPRWVRCYDDGGKSIDRYTVIYSGLRDGICRGVGMSGAPFHPQGVGQHFEYERCQLSGGQWAVDRPRYAHLGKPTPFVALPPDCQQAVLQDYAYLWDLPLDDLSEGYSLASIRIV